MPRIPYHQHSGHDDGGALSVTRGAASAGGDVAAEAAARAAADAAHAASADPHPALLSNPMTTAGDVIVGGAAGAPGRLGAGSDGDVLTIDAGTHLPAWAAPSPASEITSIPTAETDAALVLAPDGAGGVEWRAEAGGPGGAVPAAVASAALLYAYQNMR